MVEEYERGDTLAIIAERHNKSVSTVSKRLRAAGVTMRPRGRPKRTPVTSKTHGRRGLAPPSWAPWPCAGCPSKPASADGQPCCLANGQPKDADALMLKSFACAPCASEGLYAISLTEQWHQTIRRPLVVREFLERGPAQVTFHAVSIADARNRVHALKETGYCCTLVARVLGRWCRLCHRRIDRPEGRFCSGCEWMIAAHGNENAFGLCAADGERLLARALGYEIVKYGTGYTLRSTYPAFEETMRELDRRRRRRTVDGR